MKYFYISLFLSISFLVIGTAVSIEQKHSAAKAQAELLKAQELQEDDAPEAELTFGEKCLQALCSFLTGMAIVVVIFFLYAIAIIVFQKFFELII